MFRYLQTISSACRIIAFSVALAMAGQAARAADRLLDTVVEVERRLGGRVGVALRDMDSGVTWEHRADERFPVSSTFKSLLCGAVLARVDAGAETLDRRVTYATETLVQYSPVTEIHVQDGMTIADLCEAAVTISDNTAGNLLLETVGGPEGLTAFLRGIGDEVTRLDRWETDLNEGKPGDPRDTTTPNAVLSTLSALLFGEVLSEASRRQLADWMVADQVADALIRASLPESWTIGDKSGAGGFGFRSIIAVIWPPEGGPFLASIYMTGSKADFPTRNEVIAEIGRAMIAAIEAR